VQVTARELEKIAQAVAGALCDGGDAPVKGPLATVSAVALAVLQDNFRAEAAIDREVDKQLEALGAAARGMDTGKLRAGLRERIAKQKKFPL
jgi:hypothetical protein